MDKAQLNKIKEVLSVLYSETGPERVGFIHGEHSIIEVPNISKLPDEGFCVSGSVIIEHTEQKDCWATWHTHPNEDSNLSGEDYRSFKAWSNLTHFVIGNDGVKAFKWDSQKDALVEVE